MNPVKLPDGTLFRSEAAAARHLGVNVRTVVYHLDHGTLDKLVKNGTKAGPVACEWDGIRYPSQAAAARASGMSPESFRQHLQRRARLIEIVKKTFGYWPTEDGGMPPANMDGQIAERMAAE